MEWACKKTYLINWKYLKVRYNHGGAAMGRCGGGWVYKFGIMGGKCSTVIELTWITIRIIHSPVEVK